MKATVCTVLGVIGGLIANAFGGFDAAMNTLLIFMGIDYITGVIVAGVFHKSKKTETGSLKSWIGFKGLCKKGMIMLMVLIGNRLDMVLGLNVIRESVIFGFSANECLSIIENAGLMGLKLPAVVTNAVDVLAQKSDPKVNSK